MADGGPLPLEEAEHRRPPDLRVEERQQLVHLAVPPGEVDATDQLDALASPLTVSGPLGIVVRAWEPGGVGMAFGPLSLMIWGVLPPVSSGAPDR
jgi:hypothetical protein